ncbi:MAG: glycerophosphodiester phosphodiesterase family protein [Prevotella salivae]|jgi:glycerophosphodiesterase|uniref:glycerophosphodiester phosphodiesterase family protein n=1 Tax=Segatella salivae TaxID=228604 RepID=UPI001CB22A81|nr:glycerophosphodiester phosphodiesterase family protein [Segatella salivae]MBF1549349.1 glycerophosphodiester phosphodiesterase family protein [Segatella salivae]
MRTIKKSLVLLLFIVIPFSALSKGNRVDTLLQYMHDGGKSKHVMIFAHRGNWRNSAENSIQAFQDCINEGLDGIEVDLQMTKDSVLVIMHDETLDRTTTGSGKVSDYTIDELRKLRLLNPIGVKTRQTIPTFEQVLLLAKDKILIQVDKWKAYGQQVADLAKKYNCERQIILRTTDNSKATKQKYGNLLDNLIVMPVLVCKGGNVDEENLQDFIKNYSSPVMSFSFIREDYPILRKIKNLQEMGYRIWFNSLWDTFNAGHDDELAVTDPDNSYGWLINHGANIIFSDNPILLKKYLIKINRW